jgi:hypothetical protein
MEISISATALKRGGIIDVQLDVRDIRMIQNNIKTKGVFDYFESLIHNADCTRVYEDGSRPMQTIGYPYGRIHAEFKYLCYHAIREYNVNEDIIKEYIERFNKVHETNLEYEKINPPIIYRKTKAKAARKVVKAKVKDMFTGEVTTETFNAKSKESASTRKANEKLAKITKLGFKLNPVQQ